MNDFQFNTQTRDNRRLRQSLVEVRRKLRADDNAERDRALDCMEQASHDHLLKHIMQRWATGLKQVKDEAKGEYYITYTYGDVQSAIDAGHYETIVSNTLARIVDARSTLFSQPLQNWQYVTGGQDGQDNVANLLSGYRERGEAMLNLVRVDRLSNLLFTAFLRVSWRAGRLVYTPIPPQCIYLGYGDTVMEDGQTVSADTADLEDASIVTMRIKDTGSDESTKEPAYQAYVGRCEAYPQGRCVKYRGGNWFDVPEKGSRGIIEEYEINGQEANPLTWAQNQMGIEAVPYEYPVIAIHGGFTTTPALLPATEQGMDLYHDCLEIDAALSRILKAGLEAATGTKVINKGNGVLPPTVEGVVVINDGQTFDVKTVGASNAQIAMDVLIKQMRTIAEGYRVPGHLVVADEATDQQSGVALRVRLQPLIGLHKERAELNRAQINKLARIELGLHGCHTNDWSWPTDVKQSWDPGEIEVPLDPMQELDRLKREYDEGYIDKAEQIRQYFGMLTIDDAIAWMEKLQHRKEDYAELYKSFESKWTTGQPQGQPPLALGGLAARLQAAKAAKANDEQPA